MCSLLLRVCICSLLLIERAIPGDSQPDSTTTPAATNTGGTLVFGPFKSNFRCPKKYGYYADVENSCRTFHLCNPRHFQTGKTDVELFTFLCPPNTIFNQPTMNCARREESIPCHEAADFYFVNNLADSDKASELRIRNVRGDFDYNALGDDLIGSRMATPRIYSGVPIEINGPRYLPAISKPTFSPSIDLPPALAETPLRPSVAKGAFEPIHDPKVATESSSRYSQSAQDDEPLYVLENLQLRQLLRNLFELTAKTNATFEQALSSSRQRQATGGKLPRNEKKGNFDIIDFRSPEPGSQSIADVPVYVPSASNLKVLQQIIREPPSSAANVTTTETPQGPRQNAAPPPTLPTRAPEVLETSSPSVILNNFLVKSQANAPKNSRIIMGSDSVSGNSASSLKSPEKSRELPSLREFIPTPQPPALPQTQLSRPVIQTAADREKVVEGLIRARNIVQSFGRRVEKTGNPAPDRVSGNVNGKHQHQRNAAAPGKTQAKSGFTKDGAANASQPQVLKILERSFKEFQELILKRPFKQEVFLRVLDMPLKSTGGSLRQLIEAQEKLSSNWDQLKNSSAVSSELRTPIAPKALTGAAPPELPETVDNLRNNLHPSPSGRSEVVLTTLRPEMPRNTPTVPPSIRRRKSRANPSRKPPAGKLLEELLPESAEENRGQRGRTRRVKRIADHSSSERGAGIVSFVAEPIPSKPLFVWNPESNEPVFFNVPVP